MPPKNNSSEKLKIDKNFSSAFGERFRFLREKLGLNQAELAAKLGYITYQVIGRFERGERLPNIEALMQFVNLGNFNLHWLITGKPSPDGESWRENYGEVFRMYSSDGSQWIDRLRGEIADLKKAVTELGEKESRGEKINSFALSNNNELIRIRQSQLDQIKDHLKQAIDRLGGVRIEY
ncbi:MAG: helix-turn-helix transcriptional regulator [Sedimentisphaerales bacterium]